MYHQSAAGREVVERNGIDELRPYRPLDASRIVPHGRGNWDCTDFLSDLLYMPFIDLVSILFK
jgi:hypothetical protein